MMLRCKGRRGTPTLVAQGSSRVHKRTPLSPGNAADQARKSSHHSFIRMTGKHRNQTPGPLRSMDLFALRDGASESEAGYTAISYEAVKAVWGHVQSERGRSGQPHLGDSGDEVGDVRRGRPDDGHRLPLAEVARQAQLRYLRGRKENLSLPNVLNTGRRVPPPSRLQRR